MIRAWKAKIIRFGVCCTEVHHPNWDDSWSIRHGLRCYSAPITDGYEAWKTPLPPKNVGTVFWQARSMLQDVLLAALGSLHHAMPGRICRLRGTGRMLMLGCAEMLYFLTRISDRWQSTVLQNLPVLNEDIDDLSSESHASVYGSRQHAIKQLVGYRID